MESTPIEEDAMATSRDPLSGAANDPQNGQEAVHDPFDVAPRHPDSPPTLETEGRPLPRMLGAYEEEDAPPPTRWERRVAGGSATVQMPQLQVSSDSPEDPEIAAWYNQGEALPSDAWEPHLQAAVRINLLPRKPRLRGRVSQIIRLLTSNVGFGPVDPTLTPEEEYQEMEAKKTALALLVCALVVVIVGFMAVGYVNYAYTVRREAAASLILEALRGSQEEDGADVAEVLSSMDDRLAERVMRQEEELADLEAQVADLKTEAAQKQTTPASTPTPVASSPEPPTPEVVVRVRRSTPAQGFVPIRIPRN